MGNELILVKIIQATPMFLIENVRLSVRTPPGPIDVAKESAIQSLKTLDKL